MTEALHYGALLPAIAAALYRTRLPRGTFLVAAAFGMSWVGDGLALVTGGAWWPVYLWLPAQFGLAIVAVLPDRADRVMAVALLSAAALLSVLLFAPGPDVLVTLAGSAVVVAAAIYRAHPYALALGLYFGLGSALYLVMASHFADPAIFVDWWWAYQGARVAGWGAFLWTAWRYHERA